jgi:hypothetical protein
MSDKGAWWSRRSVWLWIFSFSTVIWVAVTVWLFALRSENLPLDPDPPITSANTALLDAATLTAAGAFVTSVGSLVAIVLSHLKSQRELALELVMREKELELERARLELERLKLEARRDGDDGN